MKRITMGHWEGCNSDYCKGGCSEEDDFIFDCQECDEVIDIRTLPDDDEETCPHCGELHGYGGGSGPDDREDFHADG